MKNKNTFFLFSGLFIFSTLFCCFGFREPKRNSAKEKKDHSKIEVVLVPEKKEYFLGENVLIHFCIINRGKKNDTVEMGGDYRGAWRALRFKVWVLNEKGDTIPDPYPNSMCFGGMGSTFPIKPGDTLFHTIPLNYYSRIAQEGKYTAYATHDLGWDSLSKPPVGKMTFEIKLPNPSKVEELFSGMLNEKKFDGGSWGKPTPQHADFYSIRCPLYYQLLAFKAREGNKKAVDGLGSLPTPEATQKIIDLLLDLDTANTLQLAEILIDRIPIPASEKNPWRDTSQRAWKVKNGWKNEFTPQLEKISAKYFKSETPRLREIAAYILQCVGSEKSLSIIIEEMNSELKKLKDIDITINMWPAPRTPIGELIETAQDLLKKFPSEITPGKSEGEDLVWILKLKTDSLFRPNGWQDNYLRIFDREQPRLTQAALEYMPTPVSEKFFPVIKENMTGDDITAQCHACNLVQKINSDLFSDEILQVVKTAKDEWLLDAAMYNTYKKNFRFEALEILTNRLEEKDMFEDVMDAMKSSAISEGSGSFGGSDGLPEIKRIKEAWKNFLAQNEKEIRNGKIFHVGDPQIKAEMFPKSYHWELASGKKWPW